MKTFITGTTRFCEHMCVHNPTKEDRTMRTSTIILLVIAMPFVSVFGPRSEDPKLMQLNDSIARTDVPRAKTLLEELESDWGEDDKRLIEPRRELRQLIGVLLTGEFRLLTEALRNGEFEGADENVIYICALDDHLKQCDEAGDLRDTALGLDRAAEQLDDEASGHLKRGELSAAGALITKLNDMRLTNRTFRPAVRRAADLRLRLITAASAPSAIIHLAPALTPASSSNTDSGTPPHSLAATRPWLTLQLCCSGCGAIEPPLLPEHSRNWILDCIG